MTLSRTTPLAPGSPPVRKTGLRAKPRARSVPGITTVPVAKVKSAAARKGLQSVSGKRRAENRERRAMADRLWPDRREGAVMCGCGRPECHRLADDLHEPLSRARGGSITDEDNAVPLARECHDEITRGPEWAYEAGLVRHSWDTHGGAAC